TMVSEANGGGAPLKNIIRISAGSEFSLALDNKGNVYAWGNNAKGQLGNNSVQNSPYPIRTLGKDGGGYMTNMFAIAAGGTHSMAVRSDGIVYAWGNNASGQLGTGSTTSVVVADQVRGSDEDSDSMFELMLTNITSITAGTGHSVAVTQKGKLLTWGAGDKGQLGNNISYGGGGYSAKPVVVKRQDNTQLDHVVSASAGGNHTLALTARKYTDPACGTAYYFDQLFTGTSTGLCPDCGAPVYGGTAGAPAHKTSATSPDTATAICPNTGHPSAVTFDRSTAAFFGTSYGFGENTASQLGLGDTTPGTADVANRNAATELVFNRTDYTGYFPNFTQSAFALSAGRTHTVILGDDGFIYTTGKGTRGTLGQGSDTSSAAPVRAGAREDSLLVLGSNGNTNTTRQVLEFSAATYSVNYADLSVKEYRGFNQF
ncbi:MAG: hypothetical protein RSB55_09670, partial [Oscillospiraceae bacterium]